MGRRRGTGRLRTGLSCWTCGGMGTRRGEMGLRRRRSQKRKHKVQVQSTNKRQRLGLLAVWHGGVDQFAEAAITRRGGPMEPVASELRPGKRGPAVQSFFGGMVSTEHAAS